MLTSVLGKFADWCAALMQLLNSARVCIMPVLFQYYPYHVCIIQL